VQNIDEKDIPYYQIMDAFLEQFRIEMSEAETNLLSTARDMENMPNVATEFPSIAKFVEKYGREKLEKDLLIVAIASSVAKAIVEANHILH